MMDYRNFNARAARTITKEAIDDLDHSQLKEALEHVHYAAENGEYEVVVYGTLYEMAHEALTQKGFDWSTGIKGSLETGEPFIKIEWYPK